ncbi:MAG: hypothetical protein WCV71_02435 [Patescibacteria group bacterium]|jgi:hypothetical protein
MAWGFGYQEAIEKPKDEGAIKKRKKLRKQALRSASLTQQPLPWHWDHGVLYDANGQEVVRSVANAKGCTGNPQPKPREYTPSKPKTDRPSWW